jgi:hypothetical protein
MKLAPPVTTTLRPSQLLLELDKSLILVSGSVWFWRELPVGDCGLPTRGKHEEVEDEYAEDDYSNDYDNSNPGSETASCLEDGEPSFEGKQKGCEQCRQVIHGTLLHVITNNIASLLFKCESPEFTPTSPLGI